MIDTTFALLVFLFPLAFSPGPGNLLRSPRGARGLQIAEGLYLLHLAYGLWRGPTAHNMPDHQEGPAWRKAPRC